MNWRDDKRSAKAWEGDGRYSRLVVGDWEDGGREEEEEEPESLVALSSSGPPRSEVEVEEINSPSRSREAFEPRACPESSSPATVTFLSPLPSHDFLITTRKRDSRCKHPKRRYTPHSWLMPGWPGTRYL